jgi:hypothetical protein
MIRRRNRSASPREHHAPDLAKSPASAPTWTGLYPRPTLSPVIQHTLDTGSQKWSQRDSNPSPRTTGRPFGLQPDANPVSPYLARLFGARPAWLGTEILLAESGAARRQLIRRHMAIDVVDLVATLMGWQRVYLNRRGALLTGLGAVTAIGLALRASSADPDGSP